MIPMYRQCLRSLYELYGPHCPLSTERPLNLITHSLMTFLSTWIDVFPPGGTVVIISNTWDVFKAITVLTLWSIFSATCWIWTS